MVCYVTVSMLYFFKIDSFDVVCNELSDGVRYGVCELYIYIARYYVYPFLFAMINII